MDLGTLLRGRLLDWMMRQMSDLRPETLVGAEGEVLDVGFGTALNLPFYPLAWVGTQGVSKMEIPTADLLSRLQCL